MLDNVNYYNLFHMFLFLNVAIRKFKMTNMASIFLFDRATLHYENCENNKVL